MPYNGIGVFQSLGVPIFPAVTGEYILASYFNATMNDIMQGLSTALPRDGQVGMAGDLSMVNYKIRNLGIGTLPTDAVNFQQVFSNANFGGVPTADTATPGTSTRQLATTEFVIATAFAGVAQDPTPPFLIQALGVI